MAERKGTMTDRERIEALLRREKPDRVPIWAWAMGFNGVYAQASIADSYNKPEVALASQRKTSQDLGWIFTPMLGYAAFGGWEFGGDIKWPSGEFSQAPMVSRFPVETVEDAMSLKMPDIKNSGIIPIMMEFCKLSAKERLDNEPWNVLNMVGDAFTLAGNICTLEKLCKWMIKKPEVAHHLLRMANDYMIEFAQYWKDTFGIEGVLPMTFGTSSANEIISAKQFEQFALPYNKEINEKLLAMGYKHIFVHICGEHNLNLPYWAQIHFGDPGIISIGHEVKLETAAKYFPNDIILGNLEPAIIQVRNPDEVYEATKELIERGKKISGGYIFAPGCELPAMAPVENVKAMTQAVNDLGWYD